MMNNAALATRRTESISRGVGVTTQIYADRAENAEIWDVEGKRYIDFAAGIAVVNTGHRHPRVMDAVKKQLDRFTHTCHQVVPYDNYVELAERLNKAVPGNLMSGAAPNAAAEARRTVAVEPNTQSSASLGKTALTTKARVTGSALSATSRTRASRLLSLPQALTCTASPVLNCAS